MYKVKLKLFGIFKNNTNVEYIDFILSKETSLLEFKKIICDKYLDANEYEKFEASHDSVFANDAQILNENFIIKSDVEIAILPPVCGG